MIDGLGVVQNVLLVGGLRKLDCPLLMQFLVRDGECISLLQSNLKQILNE